MRFDIEQTVIAAVTVIGNGAAMQPFARHRGCGKRYGQAGTQDWLAMKRMPPARIDESG
jgi:hypothetical protein